MFIRYRHNYKGVDICTGSYEKLPVMLKNGEVKLVPFLGFITLEEAKLCPQAIPCKITCLEAYKETFDSKYHFFDIGSLIQGCILNGGLYCVIKNGSPRIIN